MYTWDVAPTEPLSPITDALLAAIRLNPKPVQAPTPRTTEFISPDGRVSVQVLLRKAYDLAPQLGRNNTGFKLATWLRDNGYPRDEAFNVLLEYCHHEQGNTKHLYTASEAAANVRSAYSRASRAPWGTRATT